MSIKSIVAILGICILSACTAPDGNMPSSSLGPAASPVPFTLATDSNVSASALPGPAITKSIGTPVPGWEIIPIMPGAYSPELEDMVYLYTVDSTVEEVEGFYQAKLDVNGWQMTDRQQMEASTSSGPSTVLDYQKNDQTLNVMLVALPGGTSTTVILSRLNP